MTLRRFTSFLAIDWSGAAGPYQPGIALASCHADGGPPRLVRPPSCRYWSREAVLQHLQHGIAPDTLVGLDLGISLPFADAGAFFPGWSESPPDARALWRLVDRLSVDEPHLAAGCFVDHPQASRYFRRHGGREGAQFHLPGQAHRRGRFRVTEAAQERAGCKPYSNFNLVGAAQVGKSSLTGMRLLHRLQPAAFVWPVDGLELPGQGPVIVEIYTTIAAVAARRRAGRSKIRDAADLDAALASFGVAASGLAGPIDDHSADALLSSAWLRLASRDAALWRPALLTSALARTEGWTFGAA